MSLLMTAPEAAELVGIGVDSWKDLVWQGKAPAPVKPVKRRLWRRADVEAWVAELPEDLGSTKTAKEVADEVVGGGR